MQIQWGALPDSYPRHWQISVDQDLKGPETKLRAYVGGKSVKELQVKQLKAKEVLSARGGGGGWEKET